MQSCFATVCSDLAFQIIVSGSRRVLPYPFQARTCCSLSPDVPRPGIHLHSGLPGTFTDRIRTVLDADWRVIAAHVSPSPAAGLDTRYEESGGAAPPISIAPGCGPKHSHASVERSTRGRC